MATITHAIIGAALGMLFYTWTISHKKQFKVEHLIVLAINSFIGPDIPKLLSPFFGVEYWRNPMFLNFNYFVHTYLGWLIFSIPLTGLYYLIFRLGKQMRETHIMPIAISHIYFLIVAGGINHFGVDLLDGSVRIIPLFFGVDWIISLDSFKTGQSWAEGPLWNQMAWFDDKYLLLLGIFILVVLIWTLKNRSVKMSWFVGLGFIILLYGLIILIGSNAVENENDVGVLMYVIIAWILPIALCLLSLDENQIDSKIRETESTKI